MGYAVYSKNSAVGKETVEYEPFSVQFCLEFCQSKGCHMKRVFFLYLC